MSYFDFLNEEDEEDDDENGENNEEQSVDTSKERKKIRQKIRSDLRRKLKFSDSETEEVIAIIDRHEREIDYLRKSLIGLNINNENAEEDTIVIMGQLRAEGEKMALSIKQKTAEILLRKKKK